MSSRFVSAGTIAGDGSSEPQQPASVSPPKATENVQWDNEASKKNSEWEAVQRDLEADRRRREEARRALVEGDGGEKSLYDILQANKAAKQAAFEEQNRIRNQFRALDDDEIEFLDGVLDERRVEEDRVKKETEERLASFREAQKAAGTSTAAEDTAEIKDDNAVAWVGAGKKRKRSEKENKSGIVKGVRRRVSESEKEVEKSIVAKAKPTETETKNPPVANPKLESKSSTAKQTTPPAQKAIQDKPKPKLGLVDYGSDEDDDD
ncbi:hypothetical protein F4677DRAFT_346950 [Hypoxylon crocopeplum]|nr:hypothetical protein F4677DRAFT_346950 [Hypoxylon crocopeplum]